MIKDQYATWQPSPNWGSTAVQEPGRADMTPKWIIIHGTAGGGAVEWLCNTASQASAHYVIKQSGEIYQLVDEDDTAWSNGGMSQGRDAWWNGSFNPNLATISIEHEKPDDQNASSLTSQQILASFGLISRICARWNIPARQADASGGITGHFSIDPVNRSHCPGLYPWQNLFTFLAQTHGASTTMLSLSDPMGQFFADGGANRWHCKNSNVDLAYGHLDFYRRHEGIFGIPLTNEIYLSQLPGASLQIYERAIACYDPQHRHDTPPGGGQVYLLHIDKGVGQQIVAKPLVVALNAKISDLQNELAQLKTQPDNSAELAQCKAQLASYEQAFNQIKSVIK